jgi:hypothetical protein
LGASTWAGVGATSGVVGAASLCGRVGMGAGAGTGEPKAVAFGWVGGVKLG